jgi:hypothetical protein
MKFMEIKQGKRRINFRGRWDTFILSSYAPKANKRPDAWVERAAGMFRKEARRF